MLWTTCNVGATKPEHYGDYFAWGETQPKGYYDWSNYKWCNGTSDNLTKYCTDSIYGTIDNKTVLELSDDVANDKWGGKWRMPTAGELTELYRECSWVWTTQNGVDGCKITSNINGKSIFLPAAGNRYVSSANKQGYTCFYWSSSLDTEEYPYNAQYLTSCIDTSTNEMVVKIQKNPRTYGFTIRPVCK